MRAKIAVALLLSVFVVVFAIQNAQIIEIKLLVWQLEFSRALLIFLMLTIGIVIGWCLRTLWRFSRNVG